MVEQKKDRITKTTEPLTKKKLILFGADSITHMA